MKFNLIEKLAIVKSVEEVISADDQLEEEEVHYLRQLMKVLDFDIEFIQEARKLSIKQAFAVLQGMSEPKKHTLSVILQEMAKADGAIDPEEMNIISSVFINADVDTISSGKGNEGFNISDIYFESSDHIQYEKGKQRSGPHGGARRAIKIESSVESNEAYLVTSYNLDDNPPLWGNNIQMPSKQMKVIKSESSKTVLRGFGEDPSAMGDPDGNFSNYGISIIHPNNQIEKIVLHRYDRNIDIEYLK